jgi:hypothetical protein
VSVVARRVAESAVPGTTAASWITSSESASVPPIGFQSRISLWPRGL